MISYHFHAEKLQPWCCGWSEFAIRYEGWPRMPGGPTRDLRRDGKKKLVKKSIGQEVAEKSGTAFDEHQRDAEFFFQEFQNRG
ncbi:MAG: hypothetical protein U0Q18_17555 [Bryobacteraceae bacterium]